jgi:hypothetical protein
MSESTHLAKALERHFSNPRPAAFTNFVVVTDGLTAAQAAAVPAPRFNSVWGIVNHVWYWQESLLRLLRGETHTHSDLGAPDESGWPPAGNPADNSVWLEARERALAVNAALANFVSEMSAEELEQPLAVWGNAKSQAILSIIAHNSYHTCEIISVRHMQGFWVANT